MAKSHLLVGGTGAVGAVYAYALKQGGEKVGLFVRDKYRADLESKGSVTLYDVNVRFKSTLLADVGAAVAGFVLSWMYIGLSFRWSLLLSAVAFAVAHYFRLSYLPLAPIRKLTGFTVVTNPKAVGVWDYVWLCVSSAQLREGTWLEELTTNLHASTTIVCMTPMDNDKDLILTTFPYPDRIITGMISFISWQAPVKGERYHVAPPAPGIAYFFPPVPNTFCGPSHLVEGVVAPLKRGGCPSAPTANLSKDAAAGKAILMVAMLVPLELEGWSFSRLRSSKRFLGLGVAAAKEAAAIACKRISIPYPRALAIVQPLVFRVLTFVVPSLMPFDIERYLEYHFNKVGDQTALMVQDWLSEARPLDMPTTHLAELARVFADTRASDSKWNKAK